MACCEWDGDAVAQEETNLSIRPVLTVGEQHARKAMGEFHCFGEDCEKGWCNVRVTKVAGDFTLKNCGSSLHDVQP
jgi:hypothetical protein